MIVFNLLTSASSAQQPSFWASAGIWILLGVLLVGLFLFNWFTRKKQQKAAEEKMSALKAGDRIKTIGMICGTIVSIDDVQNTVVISTGDDEHPSFLTIDKSAIYQVFPAGSGVNGVSDISDAAKNEPAENSESAENGEPAVNDVDDVAEAEEIAGDENGDDKSDKE